jgi:iron complex outermembrane receptor protein
LNLAQYFHSINGQIVTVTRQNQGIYNMGRNVGFKLIFPIGAHKTAAEESKPARQ